MRRRRQLHGAVAIRRRGNDETGRCRGDSRASARLLAWAGMNKGSMGSSSFGGGGMSKGPGMGGGIGGAGGMGSSSFGGAGAGGMGSMGMSKGPGLGGGGMMGGGASKGMGMAGGGMNKMGGGG
ncbi:hypothetical protein ACHAXT_002461 [Thalassiosira profunda]